MPLRRAGKKMGAPAKSIYYTQPLNKGQNYTFLTYLSPDPNTEIPPLPIPIYESRDTHPLPLSPPPPLPPMKNSRSLCEAEHLFKQK